LIDNYDYFHLTTPSIQEVVEDDRERQVAFDALEYSDEGVKCQRCGDYKTLFDAIIVSTS
jgi:hypothetical protein